MVNMEEIGTMTRKYEICQIKYGRKKCWLNKMKLDIQEGTVRTKKYEISIEI